MSDTCVFAFVAASDVGVPGVVAGVALAIADTVPVPTAFVAETRKSYADPLVSEVTVVEVAVYVAHADVLPVPVARSFYLIT